MNRAGVAAIRSALSNVEDNLYRYSHFMRPGERTGNGELQEDVVASLEKERDELLAALEEASR